MRCLYPRTVGFLADGKTITWSQKKYSKEYSTFQLPCTKCIECRLQYGREWALRAIKEAMMYENNCFLTLTYNDENLGTNKLDYFHFQEFIKKLRTHIEKEALEKKGLYSHYKQLTSTEKKEFRNEHKDYLEKTRISVFCTGEYGSKNKRAHWHALIFNFRPEDSIYEFSNDRGDKNYSSRLINDMWGKGQCYVGDITLESAGYCARYAAKKLVHGNDGDHEYEPISKKSNKNAIGKKWLEKYWKNVFDLGYVEHDGVKHPIPRYFLKWFSKNKSELYYEFLSNVKSAQSLRAFDRAEKEKAKIASINAKRSGLKGPVQTQLDHQRKISKQKFQQLQERQKL